MGSLRSLQQGTGNRLVSAYQYYLNPGIQSATIHWCTFDRKLVFVLSYISRSDCRFISLGIFQKEETVSREIRSRTRLPEYFAKYSRSNLSFEDAVTILDFWHRALMGGGKPWWELTQFPKHWVPGERRETDPTLSEAEVLDLAMGKKVKIGEDSFPF
jgi:hypothetical protein